MQYIAKLIICNERICVPIASLRPTSTKNTCLILTGCKCQAIQKETDSRDGNSERRGRKKEERVNVCVREREGEKQRGRDLQRKTAAKCSKFPNSNPKCLSATEGNTPPYTHGICTSHMPCSSCSNHSCGF